MTRRSNRLLPTLTALLLALLPGVSAAQMQEGSWDVTARVAASGDDSEEFLAASADDPLRWPQGFSYAESSDLELGRDATHASQMVGLRFADLQVPAGARIERAALEFTADSDQSGPMAVTIRAQSAVDGAQFIQDQDGQGSFDLTSRPLSSVAQTWSPEAWSAGQAYTTPDISGLLQEIVNREEWQPGSTVVLLLSPAGGGDGFRSAHAFDSNPQLAPRLLVSYEGGADTGAEPSPPAEQEQAPASEEPEQEPEEPATPPAAPEPAPESAEAPEAAAESPPAPEPVPETGPETPAVPEPAPETSPESPPAPEPAPESVEAPAAAHQSPTAPEPAPAEEPVDAPAADGADAAQSGAPVVVEPVDPDPIVPPDQQGEEPAVWPGPSEGARAAGQAPQAGTAEAQADEEAGSRPQQESAQPEAEAQQGARSGAVEASRRLRFPLVPNITGGLRGSVLLSDYGGGITVVTVFLENPDPRVTYTASIRQGACGANGRLAVDLTPIAGDRAYSTSLVSFGFDELTGGDYSATIRRTAGEFVRVAACATLGG